MKGRPINWWLVFMAVLALLLLAQGDHAPGAEAGKGWARNCIWCGPGDRR